MFLYGGKILRHELFYREKLVLESEDVFSFFIDPITYDVVYMGNRKPAMTAGSSWN